MEYVNKAAWGCLLAAFFTSCFGAYHFWGEWLLVAASVIGFWPLTKVYGTLTGFAGAILGMTPVDYDEAEEEFEEEVAEQDKIFEGELEYSETIVGRYLDANIHEYIVYKGEQYFYENVVRDGKYFAERKHIILEPGIVYMLGAEPEKLSDTCTPSS